MRVTANRPELGTMAPTAFSYDTINNGHRDEVQEILRSDVERSNQRNGSMIDVTNRVLVALGDALSAASSTLDYAELNHAMLGVTLCRCANELADSVGDLARNMREGNDALQLEFAKSCLADANTEMLLHEMSDEDLEVDGTRRSEDASVGNKNLRSDYEDYSEDAGVHAIGSTVMRTSHDISTPSDEDIAEAFTFVQAMLLDVEGALRSIGKDDAEEIAEVGLVVARLIISMLQSVHEKVLPALLSGEANFQFDSNCGEDIFAIEELSDDANKRGATDSIGKADAANIPSDAASICNLDKRSPRLRVLWPPICPLVAEMGEWGGDTARQEPFVAAGLAVVLWPAAIAASCMGMPVLAADWAIQRTYNMASASPHVGPFVARVEEGASGLFQIGKLHYLCARLAVKQSLRVGKRQIERRGGVGSVVKDIADVFVERALHPVETVGIAVQAVEFGFSSVRQIWGFLSNYSDRADDNIAFHAP